jgi:hypothetical protein
MRRVHVHFNPAILVSLMALVIAASGGAYAATGSSRAAQAGSAAIRFAQVTSSGRVNASSQGVRASRLSHFKGAYLVTFGRNVSHCVALATNGGVPVFTSRGATTPSVVGPIRVSLSSGGFTYANGYRSEDTAEVETFSGRSHSDSSFYVAVMC